MKLIENHGTHAMKLRIVLDPALEHAVGEVEDARVIAVFRIETHRVSNFPAERGPTLFRHPAGKQAGGHPARLDHQNHP